MIPTFIIINIIIIIFHLHQTKNVNLLLRQINIRNSNKLPSTQSAKSRIAPDPSPA